MTYLFLALMILGGLTAMGYLLCAVAQDLRALEREEEMDDIGGRRKRTDAEMLTELEKWRAGK